MKKIIFLLFLLTNFGCFYTPTGPALTELNKEFELTYGNKAVIGKENLYITFKDVVGDSRCPIGAMCVWVGNGAVLLKIEKQNAATLIDTLNTYLEPHGLSYLNYKISLKDLKPYPVVDTVIKKQNYVVTLLVEKSNSQK
jgi:hypothetical protein